MKKLNLLTIVFATTIMLSACGNSNETSSNNENPSSQETTATIEQNSAKSNTPSVSEATTQAITEKDLPPLFQVSVTVEALNVRADIGIDHDVIDVVHLNDLLNVFDTQSDGDNNNWYKVQLPSGQYGWVAAWFCSEEPGSTKTETAEYPGPYSYEDLENYFKYTLDNAADDDIKSYISDFSKQYPSAIVDLMPQLENEKYVIAKIAASADDDELTYLCAWEKNNVHGGKILDGGWEVILPTQYFNDHYLIFDAGTSSVRGIEFYDMSKDLANITRHDYISVLGEDLYPIKDSSWVIYQEYDEDNPLEMYVEAVARISVYNLETHENIVLRDGGDTHAWAMDYTEATNEVVLSQIERSSDGSFISTATETISLNSDTFIQN